jgi:hypothetical protein
MNTTLILRQGTDEPRTWEIDGTDDLTGATVRFVAKVAGQVVIDEVLQLSASTRLALAPFPAAQSSAWNLATWPRQRVTTGNVSQAAHRAEWQIEITLASGRTERPDDGILLVVPELA